MHRNQLATKTVELESDPDSVKTKWTIRERTYSDLLAAETDSGVLPPRLVSKNIEEMSDEEYQSYSKWLLKRTLSIVAHGLVAIDGVPVSGPEEVIQIINELQPASHVPEIIGELAAHIANLGAVEKKSQKPLE